MPTTVEMTLESQNYDRPCRLMWLTVDGDNVVQSIHHVRKTAENALRPGLRLERGRARRGDIVKPVGANG